MFGEKKKKKKTYRLQIYLLVTSTAGFWTSIDSSERVAVAVVAYVGAVPPVILTRFFEKASKSNSNIIPV